MFKIQRPASSVVLFSICALLAAWSCPVQADEKTNPGIKDITQIYVPAEDLEAILSRDQRGVLLPRKEFIQLMEKARENARQTPRIPDGIVVAAADFQGKIVGDQIAVTATLELTQIADGWRDLRLAFRGMAIESATLDGQPARLARDPGDGAVHLLHDRKGSHVLRIELATPLVAAGGDRLAALGPGGLPAATLELAVAGGERLFVDELEPQRPAAIEKETVYKLPIGGKDELRLRITHGALEHAADRLVFAETSYRLAVSPGDTAWQAVTSLDVFGAAIDRLTVTIPPGLKITEVISTGLESWNITEPTDQKPATIALAYRQPFKGIRSISFKGIMQADQNSRWMVRSLKIAGVTSHVGRIQIEAPADLRLKFEASSQIRPVEGPLVFDAWNENFTLPFVAQPKPREVLVNMQTAVDVSSTGLELQMAATVESLYGPLFEAEFELPAEWTVTSVTIDGLNAEWRSVSAEAGLHHLVVVARKPLPAGTSMPLLLTARRSVSPWPIDEAGIEFPLPEVRFLNAGVVVGSYAVKAGEDFELTPSEVTGLDPAHLNVERERLGYRYQDTHFSGKVKIVRRPARLSAETIVVSRLDAAALRTNLRVTIESRGGGFRRLDVFLPETVGNDVRFRIDRSDIRIAEQKVSEPARGQRVWTLAFDQYVKGTINLQAVIETPRKDAKEFHVPEPRLDGVARQSGYIVVQAATDQQMNVTAMGKDKKTLRQVDLADLPPIPFASSDRSVAAYRFVQPENQVTLTEVKFNPVPVARGVCHECQIETLLDKTGNWQHEARFEFITSGVQSLRLTLPADSVLWSTLVDGQPVEVRAAEGAYQLPLPAATTPEIVRFLTVFYATPPKSGETPTEPSSPDRVPALRQSPPELSLLGDTGKPEPMEMLLRTWKLHFPADVHVTSSNGSFEPTNSLASSGALGRLVQDFGQAPTEQLVWRLLYAALAILIVALCVKGYARYQMRGVMVAISIVGLIGVAAFLLFMPSVQSAREGASRTEFKMASAAKSAAPATSQQPILGRRGEEEGIGKQGEHRIPYIDKSDKGRLLTTVPQSKLGLGAFGAPVARPSDSKKPADEIGVLPGNVPFEGGPDDPAAVMGLLNRQVIRGFTGGGRLSVPIDFAVPQGDRFREFRFLGRQQSAQSLPLLDVRFDSVRRDRAVCFAIIGVVAYVFWFLRRAAFGRKAVLAVLGLTLPLALVTLMPVAAQIWLDGIFFGTIGGLILWFIRCAVSWLATNDVEHGEATGRAAVSGAKPAAIGLLLVAIVLSNRSAFAAEEANAAPIVRPIPRPHREGVVLPYDSTKDPLSADRVFLDRRTFLSLWNTAHPEQPLDQRPPHEGIVVAAIYSAKIVQVPQTGSQPGAPHAAVSGRLVLQSFVERSITVALPFQDVTLRKAILDDKPAPILTRHAELNQAAPTTQFDVLLDVRGLHVLDVEFDVPARLTGPAGEFALRLLPVPSGRLSFEIPGNVSGIRVTGADAGFRRRREAGHDWIDVAVASASNVTIAWQPEQATGSTARTVEANATTALSLEDAGLRVQSRYRMHVGQGATSEFSFSLPAKLKLQEIRGGDVAGWKIEGTDPARKLVVTLRRPVSGDTQIEFDLYGDLEVRETASTLEAPLIAAQDVSRETGTIALFAGPQFDVQNGAVTNATQIETSSFEKSAFQKLAARVPESAYRYVATPVRLQWLVARRRSATEVAALHAVAIGRRKLTYSSRLRLTTSDEPITRAAIAVPSGFLPLAVVGNAVADWYLDEARGGVNTLMVEFSQPQKGTIALVINGTSTRNPNDSRIKLQPPLMLGVRRAQNNLTVWLDGAEQATIERADDWRSLPPDQVPAETQKLIAAAPQFVFQSDRTQPSAIVLDLARAAARLSADSVSIITATDTSVFYTLALQWTIARAAADTFTVTVPEWLAGRLDFTDPQSVNSASPRLRQVTSTKLPDGRAQWTITLQDPVQSRFFLVATAVLPPPTDGKIAAPAIEFGEEENVGAQRQIRPLSTQRQYVVLVNQSNALLAPLAADSLENVSREEIPIAVDAGLLRQAVQIVRVVRPGAANWQIEHPIVQQTAPAIVNLADLVTVFNHDGTWRTLAKYRIKNRSRQFLAIQLPPDSEILSVYVQDKPSRPVVAGQGEKTRSLIPLPAVSAADLAIEVRLILAGRLSGGPLPEGLRVLGEKRALPVPQVVSWENDRDFGIPVARTEWTTYFPADDEVRIVDEPKQTNMNPAGEHEAALFEQWAWIDEAKELLSVIELESGPSSRSNYRAIGNLKSLQSKLNSRLDSSGSMDTDLASKIGELNRVQGELNQKIQQRESQFKLNEAEQVATQAGKDTAPILTPETQAGQAKSLVQGNSAGTVNENSLFAGLRIMSTTNGAPTVTDINGQPDFGFAADKEKSEGWNFSNSKASSRDLARKKISGAQIFKSQAAPVPQETEMQPNVRESELSQDFKKEKDAEAKSEGQPPQERTPGSLSLAFEIPTSGKKLVFTKIGGDPTLTVAILPRKSLDLLLAAGWTLVWGSLGLAVAIALGWARQSAAARRSLPAIVIGAGLMVFLLFPAPGSWLGLAVLAVGAGFEASHWNRRAV